MRVVLFGGTGMVGQGVLRECLADPSVTQVLSLVRQPSGTRHPKLEEIVHRDFFDYSGLEEKFRGLDACFFCLGVSSLGKKEADYRHWTYDLTLAAARALQKSSPALTFVYVSGSGTDSGGKGRVMWARVKGETENAVAALFPKTYLFRPGVIQPLDGIRSKTPQYQWLYTAAAPLTPLLRALFPKAITTTRNVGRAMLRVAKAGAPTRFLENRDINALAEG